MFVFSQGNNISSDNCHVINLLLPLLRDVGCLLNNTDGRWGLRGDRNQGETLDRETHKVCNRTRSTRSTLTCIFNINTEFEVSNHHPPHHQMPAPLTTVHTVTQSQQQQWRQTQSATASNVDAPHQCQASLMPTLCQPQHIDQGTPPWHNHLTTEQVNSRCFSRIRQLSLSIHNPSVTLD